MREILFRGKSIYTDTPNTPGYWLEGGLVYTTTASHIIKKEDRIEVWLDENTEIWPETVGQWTGLTDKNGKKIFEGDIIATRRATTTVKRLKGYYGYDDEGYPKKIPGYNGYYEYHYSAQEDCFAEVKFNSCNGGFYLSGSSLAINAICNEVVGNIWDNPELLKGERK